MRRDGAGEWTAPNSLTGLVLEFGMNGGPLSTGWLGPYSEEFVGGC
ncbi:hypothetical protein FHR23_002235 [Stakelama sediminis]|uniref:Uncharacterized protein n=1 Tax=Stakelama sediminis TaxID=463200 RepID=A0A840Z0P3_9SPHN|nr:hypothetical protein [Stakelama sediminis]